MDGFRPNWKIIMDDGKILAVMVFRFSESIAIITSQQGAERPKQKEGWKP